MISFEGLYSSEESEEDENSIAASAEYLYQLTFQNEHRARGEIKTVHPISDHFRGKKHISLEDVIDKFSEGEELIWKRNINSPFPLTPSNKNMLPVKHMKPGKRVSIISQLSFDFLEASCSIEDSHNISVGEAFAKHGKNQEKIHEYFVKLDSRRCRSNPKIVDSKNKYKQKKKNSNKASFKEKNREKQKQILTAKESLIYDFTLQCVLHPVLPFASNNDKRGSLDNGESVYKINRKRSSLDLIDMNDNLKISKIQRAFHVTGALHSARIEETFKKDKEYSSGIYDKVVLQDLSDQLYHLDKGTCKNYMRHDYDNLTDIEYKNLQLNEISKLEHLIQHLSPNPSVRSCYLYLHKLNAHEAFLQLLAKFFRLDIKDGQLTPINNKTLSTASKTLLNDFGLRYGVRELYQRIAVLKCMIENVSIAYCDWYLFALKDEFIVTMGFLKDNYKYLVKKEREMIIKMLNDLHDKIEYAFIKIYSLYYLITEDNKNNASTSENKFTHTGIDYLISLLKLLINEKIFYEIWNKEEDPDVSVLIANYFKVSAVGTYTIIYDTALSDHTCLSVDIVQMMIDGLQVAINKFEQIYDNVQELSNICPNIVQLVASSMYLQFMQNIKDIVFLNTYDPELLIINYELLGLAYCLHQLDDNWSKYIPSKNQKWRYYFCQVLRFTLDAIHTKISNELPKSIKEDHFTCFETHGYSELATHRTSIGSITQPQTIEKSTPSAFATVPIDQVRNLLRNKDSPLTIGACLSNNHDATEFKINSKQQKVSQGVKSVDKVMREEDNIPIIYTSDDDNVENVFDDVSRLLEEVVNKVADNFDSSNNVKENLHDDIRKDNGVVTTDNRQQQISEIVNEVIDEVLVIISAVNNNQSDHQICESVLDSMIQQIVKDIKENQQLNNHQSNQNQMNTQNQGSVRKRGPTSKLTDLQKKVLQSSDFPKLFPENPTHEYLCTDGKSLSSYDNVNKNTLSSNNTFVSSSESLATNKSRQTFVSSSESLATSKGRQSCLNVDTTRQAKKHIVEIVQPESYPKMKSKQMANLMGKKTQTASLGNIPKKLRKRKNSRFPSMENILSEDARVSSVLEVDIFRNGIVLTTSSLTDLLINFQRMISFAKHVCNLLLLSNDVESIHDTIQKNISRKLEEIISVILVDYTELLVTLDFCGLDEVQEFYAIRDLHEQTTDNVEFLDNLKLRNKQGVGCRHLREHENEDTSSCVLLKHLLNYPKRWELITKEVCFRINNIYGLISVLPWLQRKILNGKKISENNNAATGELLSECKKKLEEILSNQIRLLAMKIIILYDKTFEGIFVRYTKGKSIFQHVEKLSGFILQQKDFLKTFLYEKCCYQVLLLLWKHVVEIIEKLLNDLKKVRDNPMAKAKELLKLTLSCKNILIDKAPELEKVKIKEISNSLIFRLRLYQNCDTDSDLVELADIYEWNLVNPQLDKIEKGELVTRQLSELLYLIIVELHHKRKSSTFTGLQFKECLLAHHDWLDLLSQYITTTEITNPKTKIEEIGSILLNTKYIFHESTSERAYEADRSTPGRIVSPSIATKHKSKVYLANADITVSLSDDSESEEEEEIESSQSSQSSVSVEDSQLEFKTTRGVVYRFTNDEGRYEHNLYNKGLLYDTIRQESKNQSRSNQARQLRTYIQNDIKLIFVHQYVREMNRDEVVSSFFGKYFLKAPTIAPSCSNICRIPLCS